MKRIYEAILGVISSLIIFSSPAASKKMDQLSRDYHIPNVPKIGSLDDIELVPKPAPLVLKQGDSSEEGMLAAHRSHSSHRSHVSHRSSSTSPSSTPETTKPIIPVKPEQAIPPSSTSAQPSSVKPSGSGAGEWKTSAEWLSKPCILSYHEVVVYINDETKIQGMVTGCQDNSIQVTKVVPGAGETKQWISLGDIKALLWK